MHSATHPHTALPSATSNLLPPPWRLSSSSPHIRTLTPCCASLLPRVNKPGEPPVFKYTSHAWLLDLFFDCPRHLGLNCPTAAAAAAGRHQLGVTPDDMPGASPKPQVNNVSLDGVLNWSWCAKLELRGTKTFSRQPEPPDYLFQQQRISYTVTDATGASQVATPILQSCLAGVPR